MNNKKFELTDEKIERFGRTLYRIKALKSFGNVDEGELGGFVEKEENINQHGNARVYGDARVCGNAWVCDISGILWITPVGSEYGTLTVARNKNGGLFVSRGCFSGTLCDFEAAVEKTHGNSRYGEEYRAAIKFIKLRFGIDEISEEGA